MPQTVLKAGPKYLEAFDARFSPKPSSLEAMTMVFAAPDVPGKFNPDDNLYAIITTSEAIDKAAFLQEFSADAAEVKTEGSNMSRSRNNCT